MIVVGAESSTAGDE